MSQLERPISTTLVRTVCATIATSIRAGDTDAALGIAHAMLGRADYAPADDNPRTAMATLDLINKLTDDMETWRTYAIEAGRQLAEQRQKNTELMDLARLAANINPFGSVENAKVRDTATRLLGK